MKTRITYRKNVFAISLCLSLFFIQCSSPQSQEKSTSNEKTFADSLTQANSFEQKDTTSAQSEITCPKCGHKKVETLPTDVCQLAYTCEKCKTVMHPKEGDCCVFCTYGDHKCPSMQ